MDIDINYTYNGAVIISISTEITSNYWFSIGQVKLRKVKAAAVFFSVLAIATFVVKMPLLTARYSARLGANTCEEEDINTAGNGTTPITVRPNDSNKLGETFTVTIYTLVGVLRIVEYSFVSYGLVTFVWKCSHEPQITESLKKIMKQKICKRKELLCFVVMLTPYFLLGTAVVPALGITLEIVHTQKVTCDKHIGNLFFAYCSLDVVRYALDFSVRVGMITTTLVARKVWDTSVNVPSTVESESGTSENSEPLGSISDELVRDMQKTDAYVKTLQKQYQENGTVVQTCNQIFETWFVLPWIVYVVAASLEVGNLLLPWKDDNETLTSSYPKIFYLAYSVNQLITLFIPYLCAKQIEAYHKKYFEHIEGQISSKTFGAMMKISKSEYYDFCPRIVGTDIIIDLSNPLFFLFLLVGFFFTISKTLL